MLPIELRTELDKRWEACWPTNTVRPLVIVDLVTYLLFIQQLDEWQLRREKEASHSDALIDEPLFASVQEELRWYSFKDADGDTLYKLFTKEQGVLAFMQSYGEGGHTYSGFLKTP
ncbi:MAG: hypothetical protein ICV65_16105, partial [Flavisolibacter sp.]|nr:hypothetical protein [Flavisolibacter sp.]